LRFYLYCRQNGLWPKEVAGFDPQSDPKALEPFCPIRHVTENYPPTMLIHGTNDTDVPHEQSVQMNRELARHGVPHEFISVQGGGHGLGGLERNRLAEIRERVVTFLGRHLA
jgi:dipeptidyl aminopeptidase/acylaminoacyl peptidase